MKIIILAGGLGKRLWPISREINPKSLLKVYKEKSILQNVSEMALEITAAKNIITVSNVKTIQESKIQLSKTDKNLRIISEPMQKNTAAAIASALTYIKSKRDETVVILPVDFTVKNKEILKEAIEEMVKLASTGNIIALGVKPKYAEVGYGYIKTGMVASKCDGTKDYKISVIGDLNGDGLLNQIDFMYESASLIKGDQVRLVAKNGDIFVVNLENYISNEIQNFCLGYLR